MARRKEKGDSNKYERGDSHLYKRLFSVLICVGLMSCMALNSFAALDFTDSYYDNRPYFVDKGDGNTYFGTLDTASMTEEQKDFMRDFLEVSTGAKNSDSTYAIFAQINYSNAAALFFVKCSADLEIYYNGDYVWVLGVGNVKPEYLKFSYNTSSGVFSAGPLTTGSVQNIAAKASISRVYPSSSYAFVGGLLWSNKTPVYTGVPSTGLKSTYNGSLGFVDNDGLLSPEEPEEPSSSEPETPSSSGAPVPTLPEIPAGDGKYVPYETSIWLDFIIHILSTMSVAARVGIIIFASLLGVLLIIWVPRWFLSSK